jgi:putative aminopeptidase FrvX
MEPILEMINTLTGINSPSGDTEELLLITHLYLLVLFDNLSLLHIFRQIELLLLCLLKGINSPSGDTEEAIQFVEKYAKDLGYQTTLTNKGALYLL